MAIRFDSEKLLASEENYEQQKRETEMYLVVCLINFDGLFIVTLQRYLFVRSQDISPGF